MDGTPIDLDWWGSAKVVAMNKGSGFVYTLPIGLSFHGSLDLPTIANGLTWSIKLIAFWISLFVR